MRSSISSGAMTRLGMVECVVHRPWSEPEDLAIVGCRTVDVLHRQARPGASRKADSFIGAQADSLIEIGQRLGIGAGVTGLALGDCLLVRAVARVRHDF